MTYREAKMRAAGKLQDAGIENALAESGFLLEHALGTDRNFYLLHQSEDMPPDEFRIYDALVSKRCMRIPLQHLTGEQEFMGFSFRVNDHVLIPRQDTETLVEEALSILHQNEGEHPRVLDLCTGSGCIAICLDLLCENARVTGSDLSEEALRVAKENARINHSDAEFVHSDLFASLSTDEGMYDMIVSNPPYIPTQVIETLMPEVRDHEPISALDGHSDGLHFYRRIIKDTASYLQPGGYLLFEIGCEQGEAVADMMRNYNFTDIDVIPDLAGLDRVVRGRKQKRRDANV